MTGRYEEHLNGSWSTDVEWTYSWDVQDRLVCVEKDAPGTANDRKVEYRYCPSCGGELTERIEYSDAGQTVSSWLRYEYDGLNLLRIDERYDGDLPADGIDENDPWTCRNVFVHAPGQIGQVLRNRMYDYGWCFEELQYHYDALGNVVGYTDSTGGTLLYEMDAFGRAVPGSTPWEPMSSIGPKEHLTGKMYDDVTGLYYFHARWYDPEVGRFVSRDPLASCYIQTISYVFASTNPLLFIDPDGLQAKESTPSYSDKDPSCCTAKLKKLSLTEEAVSAQFRSVLSLWLNQEGISEEVKGCMQRTDFTVRCVDCTDKKLCGYAGKGKNFISLCMDQGKFTAAKGLAYTMLHERAHNCGWGAGDPNEFPWGKITTPVAVQNPKSFTVGTGVCETRMSIEDYYAREQ